MKDVLIVGATGFGGLGLIEILSRHPEIKIKGISARKDVGKHIREVFPHLHRSIDLEIQDTESLEQIDADLVFFSTPDRAGMFSLMPFYDKGMKIIDFSGDFRFTSPEDYAVYARNKSMDDTHNVPHLLGEAVYGLPEVFRSSIEDASIVGNPGCFATAMILGLRPLVEKGIITEDTIICDGKTGVSGAGKNSGEANLYPQRYENINTYREGRHQHLVEVEQVLNRKGTGHRILFMPQVVPMTRGILMTMYGIPAKATDTEKLLELYSVFYSGERFISITDSSVGTGQVRGSNTCLIRPFFDERTGMVVVTTAIDNLLKGQSGTAVQNANLMLKLDEYLGLDMVPFYP